MAFIREYAAMSRAGLPMGDPFAFRIPKKFRKMKLGKSLLGFARGAIGFIPGLGPIASGILGRLSASTGLDQNTITEFARSRGIDLSQLGDPGAPKPQQKRKAAASGTKAKAKKKADRRAGKTAAVSAKPKKKGKGGGMPNLLDPNVRVGLEQELLKLVPLGQQAMDVTGLGKAAKPAGLFGRRRRQMNPSNVKALRRGIRRIEGFEKLVKHVERAFPRMRYATRRAPQRQVGGGRGHKRGCACAVCSRVA